MEVSQRDNAAVSSLVSSVVGPRLCGLLKQALHEFRASSAEGTLAQKQANMSYARHNSTLLLFLSLATLDCQD